MQQCPECLVLHVLKKILTKKPHPSIKQVNPYKSHSVGKAQMNQDGMGRDRMNQHRTNKKQNWWWRADIMGLAAG